MLQLSSLREAIASVEYAKDVSVAAYTLHGALLQALEGAARHGAHVVVQLEGQPYDRGKRRLARENARLVHELRAAGADARLAPLIHAKSMSVDGTLYLDGKNWHASDVILREDDAVEAAAIPMDKHDALALEAEMLASAKSSDAPIVESESFGLGNATYFALQELARSGAAPRLLVSKGDLRGNARERSALEHLAARGVRVRVCTDSEKLAVAGNRAWLGSANATYADGKFAMSDWGVCSANPAIVDTARVRLESEWRSAKEL
ncbi:MAG TPA: hypothetical protein VKR05_03905 [Candidatus Cybelea sp.]|nr:hypothetical protein [Candidatus Cybelea sp.]